MKLIILSSKPMNLSLPLIGFILLLQPFLAASQTAPTSFALNDDQVILNRLGDTTTLNFIC